MPTPCHFIDNQRDLAGWVAFCQNQAVVAVDTESDSLHRYREKVCLIQMTAGGEDAIIDPLALTDLSALAEVFINPNSVKVLHDSGYDLLCLYRDFGFRLYPIFDTMLACRLLGYRQFGLAILLQTRFAFVANKRMQRSDWGQRPLSSEQLHYARYDTHFLPALRLLLTQELHDRQRLDWAQEEFIRLPKLWQQMAEQAASRNRTRQDFYANSLFKQLSSSAQPRFAALWLWRDQLAARLDRPVFRVLADKVLAQLAAEPPPYLAALTPFPGLPYKSIQRYGRELLAVLAQAPALPSCPQDLPKKRPPATKTNDAKLRKVFNALRQTRKEVALALGLDPEVLLGNAALQHVLRRQPASVEDLTAMPEIAGWRAPLVAKALWATLVEHQEDF